MGEVLVKRLLAEKGPAWMRKIKEGLTTKTCVVALNHAMCETASMLRAATLLRELVPRDLVVLRGLQHGKGTVDRAL